MLSPGSPAGIAAGCVCFHTDNMDGRGCSPRIGEPRRFIIEAHCPLHGRNTWPTTAKEKTMRLTIIESPFAGDIPGNLTYARACVRDCLQRGEAPIASHLLFTQEGILRDDVPGERKLGIEAGLAWYRATDCVAFYLDRGMSGGMLGALDYYDRGAGPMCEMEFRFLDPLSSQQQLHRQSLSYMGRWERPMTSAASAGWACQWDHPRWGRFTVDQHRRPPTPNAPWELKLMENRVAFYPSWETAIAGAELLARFMGAIDSPIDLLFGG